MTHDHKFSACKHSIISFKSSSFAGFDVRIVIHHSSDKTKVEQSSRLFWFAVSSLIFS